MKIKNISCTQFAGIRDKSITLSDGINIVYGKNESGKSTFVNLLSKTLFQNSKIDGRSDKEFRALYFPGKNRIGEAGDFADGKVVIETDKGEYTLLKDWGSGSRCELSTPSGIIRDEKKINGILKEILVYGEGVYSDMLFSARINRNSALRALISPSEKTDAKREITDAVTRAFAQGGGVSIDAIGNAIAEKIKQLQGAHWDYENELPARKPSGRWSTGVGEVLKAYYAYEDAKEELEKTDALENDLAKANADYSRINDKFEAAKREYELFNGFAGRIAAMNERKAAIRRIENEIALYGGVLREWPRLRRNLDAALSLKEEKTRRAAYDKYMSAKKLSEETKALSEKLSAAHRPEKTEILAAKAAERSIASLENKLRGMNITACVKMLKDADVEITSVRTGESVSVSDGRAEINEAVRITVPDVMEMLLAPSNIDTDNINDSIAKERSVLSKIYKKYGVSDVNALDELSAEYDKLKTELDKSRERLQDVLNGEDPKTLEAIAKDTASMRAADDIDADIAALCGGKDIGVFITEKETLIRKNENDHGSEDDLRKRTDALSDELEKLYSLTENVRDIPDEYLKIRDIDAYSKLLKNTLDTVRAKREDALTNKNLAKGRLEAYLDENEGGSEENTERAKIRFLEQKSLLSHWKHIEAAFKKIKEELEGNPMEDISERFAYYLNIISDGGVSSEFLSKDSLDMNIYSGEHLLDYGKLSEGTKDAVSLAFRLAALDHLFPDGGVAVFDDPFADMDDERVKRSCEVLSDFAKRHQVIFLTCREEYLSLINGTVIRI